MNNIKIFFDLVGDLPLDGDWNYRYMHELYRFCRFTGDYNLWYYLHKKHLRLTRKQVRILIELSEAKGIDISEFL